jgi:hypothetical protein
LIGNFCFAAWQKCEERAAYANFTLEPHPAALRFHDSFGQRQAQSRALKLLRDSGVQLVELLKQMLLVFLRNADSGILHFQTEKSFRLSQHADRDLALGRREFQGVG